MHKQEQISYNLPNSSSEVDWRMVSLSEDGIEIKLYQTTDSVEDSTYLNGYILFSNYNLIPTIESKIQFQKYLNKFLDQIGGLGLGSNTKY